MQLNQYDIVAGLTSLTFASFAPLALRRIVSDIQVRDLGVEETFTQAAYRNPRVACPAENVGDNLLSTGCFTVNSTQIDGFARPGVGARLGGWTVLSGDVDHVGKGFYESAMCCAYSLGE